MAAENVTWAPLTTIKAVSEAFVEEYVFIGTN
jgi:hypothetical protein